MPSMDDEHRAYVDGLINHIDELQQVIVDLKEIIDSERRDARGYAQMYRTELAKVMDFSGRISDIADVHIPDNDAERDMANKRPCKGCGKPWPCQTKMLTKIFDPYPDEHRVPIPYGD